ncbi:proline-rich extensin-like protein EPR1 isoform X2 [Denticeps clupeoides]|uniref:proline-rich extensin-like protein EPR1 isoform X2 n=1 Tax=Denticeps clupeoides TaxID=299321 RepID=UPI0010A40FDD|nr:proline-rich extensin-like protein EPR1 isoform X2 [Denticeps clupeoides]
MDIQKFQEAEAALPERHPTIAAREGVALPVGREGEARAEQGQVPGAGRYGGRPQVAGRHRERPAPPVPLPRDVRLARGTWDAFWGLVQICEKYLPGYYSAGLEAIQLDGEILFALLKHTSTVAYRHLEKHKIEPILYMTEWFMCAFSRTLPWASVLRVWDMFLCDGVKIIFRVGLVLLRSMLGSREKLKACPGQYETMELLRALEPKYMQEGFLVHQILELSLSVREVEREYHVQLKRWKRKHGELSYKSPPRLHGAYAVMRAEPHSRQDLCQNPTIVVQVPAASSQDPSFVPMSQFNRSKKRGTLRKNPKPVPDIPNPYALPTVPQTQLAVKDRPPNQEPPNQTPPPAIDPAPPHPPMFYQPPSQQPQVKNHVTPPEPDVGPPLPLPSPQQPIRSQQLLTSQTPPQQPPSQASFKNHVTPPEPVVGPPLPLPSPQQPIRSQQLLTSQTPPQQPPSQASFKNHVTPPEPIVAQSLPMPSPQQPIRSQQPLTNKTRSQEVFSSPPPPLQPPSQASFKNHVTPPEPIVAQSQPMPSPQQPIRSQQPLTNQTRSQEVFSSLPPPVQPPSQASFKNHVTPPEPIVAQSLPMPSPQQPIRSQQLLTDQSPSQQPPSQASFKNQVTPPEPVRSQPLAMPSPQQPIRSQPLLMNVPPGQPSASQQQVNNLHPPMFYRPPPPQQQPLRQAAFPFLDVPPPPNFLPPPAPDLRPLPPPLRTTTETPAPPPAQNAAGPAPQGEGPPPLCHSRESVNSSEQDTYL